MANVRKYHPSKKVTSCRLTVEEKAKIIDKHGSVQAWIELCLKQFGYNTHPNKGILNVKDQTNGN